jgi:hypothetical protein
MPYPFSGLKSKPSKSLLTSCFMLVSYLAYYSILNMETIYSIETSVDFQFNTWNYIPEDRTLRILVDKTGISNEQRRLAWFCHVLHAAMLISNGIPGEKGKFANSWQMMNWEAFWVRVSRFSWKKLRNSRTIEEGTSALRAETETLDLQSQELFSYSTSLGSTSSTSLRSRTNAAWECQAYKPHPLFVLDNG